MVQQDVEAQDFKAGTVKGMAGEAGVVVVFDDWGSRDHCLDDDILDSPPYLTHVEALVLHVRVEGRELPGREPQATRQGSWPLAIQGHGMLKTRNFWRR